MPNDHRHRNRLLCPRVPVVNMNIGATDGTPVDLDQNVIDADGRHWHVAQPQSGFGSFLNKCFHQSCQGSIFRRLAFYLPRSRNLTQTGEGTSSVLPVEVKRPDLESIRKTTTLSDF